MDFAPPGSSAARRVFLRPDLWSGFGGGDVSHSLAASWSEIMNHRGRKRGPQGIQHGQHVNDFLCDRAAHRTEVAGCREALRLR